MLSTYLHRDPVAGCCAGLPAGRHRRPPRALGYLDSPHSLQARTEGYVTSANGKNYTQIVLLLTNANNGREARREGVTADRGCRIHGSDNLNALDAQELATFVVEACMIMVTVRIMLGRKDMQRFHK